MNKKLFGFFTLALLALLTAGCSFFATFATDIDYPRLGSGSMLVRHGSYLYRMGGIDTAGTVLSSVEMAKIELDESGDPKPLDWQPTGSLPEGRAFGAAFAFGNIMYLLGGDNGQEPTSTIYYALIDGADGSLGYGASKYWVTETIHLPKALSHFTCELYDGRIFLAGGIHASGISDEIWISRIHQDGFVGQWYKSPKKLGVATYGAASAIKNNTLIIGGGSTGSGKISSKLIEYSIGDYGMLGDAKFTTLPASIYSPLLISDDEYLILAGGFDKTGSPTSTVYKKTSSGIWNATKHAISAVGPSFARTAGSLWYLKQESANQFPEVAWLKDLNLAPERIQISPGTGFIPAGSPIRLGVEPGVIILSSTDGTNFSAWKATSVSNDSTWHFIAYDKAGRSSPVTISKYMIGNGGVATSGTLAIKNPGESLDTIYLCDSMTNPLSKAYSTIWCFLNIYDSKNLSLHFGGGSIPAGRAGISLFEYDTYTEVLDCAGSPILDRTTTNSTLPQKMTLNPGRYFLRIQDLDGISGRSLGLGFFEE